MTTYRARGISPPSRRYADPRNSTGPVFSTAFDTRYAQQPRNTFDTLPSSRAGAERHYDAQPISRTNYGASGHSTAQSKTEYSVRPRNNSSVGDDGRTPLRILAPATSPTGTRPVVDNSPYDQPRSPLTKRYYAPDESERYIVPAVSSPRQHRRQVSATLPDSTHLAPLRRDRRERSLYRIAGSRVYPTGGAPVRYEDEDSYSYTTPREQFDRDYPPRIATPRPNSYVRKDRPISTSEFDEWKAVSLSKGEMGPPPAVRQFDRIGNGESRLPTSRSGNHSDTEGDFGGPRRRHSLRAPVALHQDRKERSSLNRDDRTVRRASQYQPKAYDEEPTYSSDRENYGPSSYYERRQQRPKVREESRERTGKGHGIAAAGLGGLAAASLTGALAGRSRDKDDDPASDENHDVKDRHVRERDQNVRDVSEERERTVEKPRDRAADLRDEVVPRERRRENGRKEKSGTDSVDDIQPDGHRHRREHRHRRPDSRPQELESDSTSDDRKGVEVPKAIDHDRRERESAQEDSDLIRRDSKHSRTPQLVFSADERYAETPAQSDQDEDLERRAARLQLVEPSKEKEPEPRPKGILKPARQVPFPEDPNPTREGVAPLKDAGKKGIPPGARWTKINRMLVNPAALEAAHERFEERDDYVIVLRVLSREDIQNFADKTKEIRGKQN